MGDIIVFNGVSANGDGKNEIFRIEFDLIPETRTNRVTIFNRWGDLVWEGENYDNDRVVFSGKNNNGSDLPSGTYFYKIDFTNGRPEKTGFLSLKR